MPAPSRESIEGAAETSDRGVRAVSSIEMRYWCCREGTVLPRPVGLSPGKCGVARVEGGESGGQPDKKQNARCQPYEARGKKLFWSFLQRRSNRKTENSKIPKLANRKLSPNLIVSGWSLLVSRQRLFSISIGLIRLSIPPAHRPIPPLNINKSPPVKLSLVLSSSHDCLLILHF
jgi:hypothetical protein